MSQQELTSLLQKYLSKEITPAEKQALARLIAQHADEEQIKASVEDLWNEYEPAEQMSGAASEAYFQGILQQIKPVASLNKAATVEEIAGTQRTISTHRVHFLRRSWGRVAAAAVIAAVIGSFFYFMLQTKEDKHDLHVDALAMEKRIITRHITLPDGSQVILQDNSHLDYPASFTGNTREVTLTGEAYFDVAHNEKQPFIIHSGKVKTTVLGTAFNIKAWPADEEVTVTVTRGKVKVEDDAHLLGIITPDQQISFNTRNEQARQATVDAGNEVSWKDKEYTFDDVPFDEAITEIQMRYGVLIELSNRETAELCSFTASFKQGESLDYVLDVISKLYKASWRKEADRIVIDNVHCNS